MESMPPYLCRYYERCGGCSLQHLAAEDYATFKREILVKMVHRLGLDASLVQKLVAIGPRSRRRVEFKIETRKGDVQIGFHAHKSHELVDIEDCPVTENQLTVHIPALRLLIASLKKPGIISGVHLTALADGLDMCFLTKSLLPTTDRQAFIDYAMSTDAPRIIRLSEQAAQAEPQILYSAAPATIRFGQIEVELPLQPFLQATQAGQDALTQCVLDATRDAQSIADFYCGCGTYSLPLAQRGQRVTAYEGGYDMVIALLNSARRNGLEELLSAETRDLVKNPVPAHQLKGFDAIVINPPRNGASPQVKQIGKSMVPRVIMVSCNPTTFERDARFLLNAGYSLTSATPIDQFYMTHHLELMGVFKR
jgi:23S rRNA (uracil1939-C5)-methyltransferase